jgi:hypothetical protein
MKGFGSILLALVLAVAARAAELEYQIEPSQDGRGGKVVFTADLDRNIIFAPTAADQVQLELDGSSAANAVFPKPDELSCSIAKDLLTCLLDFVRPTASDAVFGIAFVLKDKQGKPHKFSAMGTIPRVQPPPPPTATEKASTTAASSSCNCRGSLAQVCLWICSLQNTPLGWGILIAGIAVAAALVAYFSLKRRARPEAAGVIPREFTGPELVLPSEVQVRTAAAGKASESASVARTEGPKPALREGSVVGPAVRDTARLQLRDTLATAEGASTQAADAVRMLEALARDLPAKIEQVLRPALDDLRSELRRAVGAEAEIRTVGSVIKPRTAPSLMHSRGADQDRDEQVLLAAINRWIALDGEDRQELPKLARNLGLETRLMMHVNLIKLSADATALSDVEFETSESDGGWLWVDTSPNEAIAAPADARLFRSGQAPLLLERTFEGSKGGGESLRIAKIYRACRLRRKDAGGRFAVVQKGTLQLWGRPAPDLPPPREYSLLEQQQHLGQPSLAGVLRGQLELISGRLFELENAASGMRQGEQGIQASAALSLVVDDLGKQIRLIQQAQSSIVSQVKRLADDRTELKPAVPGVAGSFTPQVWEGRLADLETRTEAVRTQVEELLRLMSGRQVFAAPAPQPAEGASTIRQDVSAVSSPPLRKPVSADTPLPEGWAKAVSDRVTGPLSEELQTRKLAALVERISRLGGQYPIRLVHVAEGQGKFRVHDARIVDDRVICNVCGSAKTYESACCAGSDGAPVLHILLPLGLYAPYNYPAGYSQFLQDVPPHQFEIRSVGSPAVLQAVSGSPGEYMVQQKMQWT